MGSIDSLKAVVDIIRETRENNVAPVVVCSAMSGVTNQLFEIGALAQASKTIEASAIFKDIKARHFQTAEAFGVAETFGLSIDPVFDDLENLIKGISLLHELSPKSKAYLTGFGEKFSTHLLTEILKTQSIPALQLDANFIRLKGGNFEEDELDWEQTNLATPKVVIPLVDQGQVPVVTGFFGVDSAGVMSLLGRGGSDFSAAILAVSLGVDSVEIWTDVDGFLSADPRIMPKAQIIEEIGFEEASELCFFGAKVLHPKTIRPVIDRGGEVWIKNTFAPKQAGTRITREAKPDCRAVISISSKKVCMASLDIFASTSPKRKIFNQLFTLADQFAMPIDMMASSEAQISFCTEERFANVDCFWDALNKVCKGEMKLGKSIVCIVSPKEVKGKVGIAGKLFSAIEKANASADMYSQNASEVAQLVVVDTDKVPNVIKTIHEDLIDTQCH